MSIRSDADCPLHFGHCRNFGVVYCVFPLKNVLRPDETAPSADRASLLAGAPAADGESFLVPKAVE